MAYARLFQEGPKDIDEIKIPPLKGDFSVALFHRRLNKAYARYDYDLGKGR